MSLAVGDYVYVHREGLYGRIKDIWEREETFYTVEFPCYPIEDEVFEGRELVKMENPYFPKGSIVTGLKGADVYVVTTDKAVMEVLRVREESMEVKILSHETRPHCKGSLYTVDPVWFKLARPRTNFYRGEKED